MGEVATNDAIYCDEPDEVVMKARQATEAFASIYELYKHTMDELASKDALGKNGRAAIELLKEMVTKLDAVQEEVTDCLAHIIHHVGMVNEAQEVKLI